MGAAAHVSHIKWDLGPWNLPTTLKKKQDYSRPGLWVLDSDFKMMERLGHTDNDDMPLLVCDG